MTQTLEELEEEYKILAFFKVVDEEGKIIGSIRCRIKDGTSYIDKTFVRPDYQGEGIGTKMIKMIEEKTKLKDMK